MATAAHPISQFVLKVHGRCDLACDHCYVYESPDQSWRAKPKLMAMDTVRVVARRIGEHAARWRLPEVRVVLHGGEPLLLGPARLAEVLAELTATIPAAAPHSRLTLSMQTNGVRLDGAACDVLKAHAVNVGVSLDGDRSANDRHRRYQNGASSHDEARAALALLRTPKYHMLYSGILCTIDVRNDPRAVYEALAAEQPPRVDFLLPHATWARPPLRPPGDPTPYATWLSTIHARWLQDGRPFDVRMFDAIRSTAHGAASGSEQLGADPADLLVVDTDGGWEQADSTKISFPGAPDTGMHVSAHTVDDVSRYAPVAQRQTGVAGLSATCQRCPVVAQCGGGLYAHRYRPGAGFANPSVYCDDLLVLIPRINEANAAAKPDDPVPPEDLVERIAAGFGDEPTMRALAAAELNITRALLVSVVDQAGDSAAWRLLTEVERRDPEAVARVLSHPYVRVWAVNELRADAADAGYLGEIAAAAAVHAGVPGDVPVTIRGGVLHLPTVGSLVRPESPDGPAHLEVRPGTLRLLAPDGMVTVDLTNPAPGWRPARLVRLDDFDVQLEDADPHRDCHRWPLDTRPDEAELTAWQKDLTAAWELIRAEVPGYRTGLRIGLRTVVPLQRDPAGLLRASTVRDAFGSVAAARATAAELAVILVHEFQHGKLGALLDLFDLFDPQSSTRIKVGWRPDPRPIEAVLQGVYAHAAVADVWRVRAGRDADDRRAREVYAQYHAWTTAAVQALLATDALTPLGRRFVDRLDETMAAWTPPV